MALTSVVIGSVLKPVDDVRHYHKLGLSMAKTNKYEVNIIGFNSKNTPSHPYIRFYPIFSFSRLSVSRLFAPFLFLRFLLRLKPEVVIVNSAELLIVTAFYRIFSTCRFFYDVQENYYLNVRCLSPLPFLVRLPAAALIRAVEFVSSPFVHHFILAEKSYATLPFVGSRWTVLENKSVVSEKSVQQKIKVEKPTFLLSGTLSLNYGLRESIDAFLLLREIFAGSSLLICGKTHDAQSEAFIQRTREQFSEISYNGGPNGVPYDEIVAAIKMADIGLVFYPDNPAIDSCFPTKIWEYMSFRLPMIVQEGKNWTPYCLAKNAAITIEQIRADSSFPFKLSEFPFYPTDQDYGEIYWSREEEKFLSLLGKTS